MRVSGGKMFRRYLRLIFANYKNSLMFIFEYRADFFILIFKRALNLFLSLFLINIVFLQTPQLAGWGRYELFIIFGSYLVAVNVIKAFVDEGLAEVPYLVRTGRLDLYLTKPVSPRFLLSFRIFSFDHLFDIFFGLAVIFYSLNNLQATPAFFNIFNFLLTVIFSSLVFYFIYFIFITFSIWFIRLDNLRNLFGNILDMARVPPRVYKGAVGFIFTFFIPLAFISVFPTEAILDLLSFKMLFLELSAALIFNFISVRFWEFALKYYTSASS